ncbi:hypothetical protein ACB092_01G202800 [Castanea dentata]
MPMMIQSTLLRCCGAKILPRRVNLLGEATLNRKVMDLTEAIIICEISFYFMSLVLVFVIDVFSVIYCDSLLDLCNLFDIDVQFSIVIVFWNCVCYLGYYFMLKRLGCLQVLCFIKYNQPMMFFNPTCLRGVRSQDPVLQDQPM